MQSVFGLDNVNWGAVLSHPIDDPGPWIALLVAGGAVLIGYVEMRMHRNVKVGLSTWGFALAPFSVAIYWIATWSLLSLISKLLLIVVLVTLSWMLLRYLYAHAKKMTEAGSNGEKQDSKVPGSN